MTANTHVDETLDRFRREARGRELPSFGFYLLLIILSLVPFYKNNDPWWLCLLILVGPVIYVMARRQSRLTEAAYAALPDEAKEEFERQSVQMDQMAKKMQLIIIPIAIVWCVGFIFWGQHVLEKREREMKEELMLRMQQKQQRNAPGVK